MLVLVTIVAVALGWTCFRIRRGSEQRSAVRLIEGRSSTVVLYRYALTEDASLSLDPPEYLAWLPPWLATDLFGRPFAAYQEGDWIFSELSDEQLIDAMLRLDSLESIEWAHGESAPLERFAQLRHLKFLDLTWSDEFGEARLRRLQEALPKVTLIYDSSQVYDDTAPSAEVELDDEDPFADEAE
jgi:hypothetical protein